MARDGLVVIESNLASLPLAVERSGALSNPFLLDATLPEELRFQGPRAFDIPEVIQLELLDRGEEELESDIRQALRALGHSVCAYIQRDQSSTMVSLNLVEAGGPDRNARRLGWSVAGLAAIPDLGVDRIELKADRVADHRLEGDHNNSAVQLFSLPRGILLQ
jgi:hypothetical protein